MLLISGLKICSNWILEGRGKAPVICKNRDVATVFYASKSYKTFKVSGAGHEPEKTFFHFILPHCVAVVGVRYKTCVVLADDRTLQQRAVPV